ESEPGRGSTFRFRIPATRHRAAEPPPEKPAPATAGRGTILVIDDDARARKALGEANREGGFAVREASSGASGLAIARECPPDAIVLDVIMAEQDGWSVLQEIKADQRLCEIPVILATV